jgi:putative nucleotidyltransferase with HDIG domain
MDKHELFEEIDAHLLSDEKPSEFFKGPDSQLFETTHPFTMLSGLKDIKQSPIHHPEGSVWNHTLLVLDEAAARKDQAADGRVFMWAALLHDIGKAVTTKVRKGKITAYDHDKVGAEMVRTFLREFEDEPIISKVVSLVRWHMQILYVAKGTRFADLDAMRNQADVRDVALLGLCDRLGRLNVNRRAEEQVIQNFLRKVDL